MNVRDVLGYSATSAVAPDVRFLRLRPSCVCKPQVETAFARAYVSHQKKIWRQFTDPAEGEPAAFYTTKTVVDYFSRTFTFTQTSSSFTLTSAGSVTTVENEEGSTTSGAGSRSITTVNVNASGETRTENGSGPYELVFGIGGPFEGGWRRETNYSGTNYDGSPITQITHVEFVPGGIRPPENHPMDDWILASTEYPSPEVEVKTFVPGRRISISSETLEPDPDSTGTRTITTTLSDEFTTSRLESEAEALFAVAEEYLENVYWRPGIQTHNYRIAAAYGAITEEAANAAIDAAQDEVDLKAAALASIGEANELALHIAQNELDLANLTKEIAEYNLTQVGLSATEGILLQISADGGQVEAYRKLSGDESSITLSSIRYRHYTDFNQMPSWKYEESPVPYKFRWRVASWNDGATAPSFSNADAAVENATVLAQSEIYRHAFAVQVEPQSLALPATPGMKVLASPLPEGSDVADPVRSFWENVNARGAAMRKVGFAAYTQSAGAPPVIYRKETVSGAATGFQEWKALEYLYEYQTELPEGFDLLTLTPSPGQTAPHQNVIGTILSPTQRQIGAGDGALVFTLSDPWTNDEIEGAVNAHVESDWSVTELPIVPDTAANIPSSATISGVQFPSAALIVAAKETYFGRLRTRYKFRFSGPDSLRYHPNFLNPSGYAVEWHWKEKTYALATGLITEEAFSEEKIYQSGTLSLDADEEWRELPTPSANVKIWVTPPETTDPWCWGGPECRVVCG